MATLLGTEVNGGRLERTWAHDGKLTVEVVQDVEPVIENAKLMAQHSRETVLGRFKANVTFTQLEEACRINCKLWGVSLRECLSEVMRGKTERAQRVMRTLTEGSDYAKLQARHWR